MQITILDDYQDCVRGLEAFQRLDGHKVRVFHDPAPDLDTLAERLADAEALVLTRERTPIDAALLARLPRLRLVSTAGAVPGNLDVEACSRLGIGVADGKGSGAAAAELCWALVMASRRHLVDEANRLRAGQWQGHLGRQLRGSTLGIWGYGRVGRQVAAFGRAFGMQVCVWGRASTLATAQAEGVGVATSQHDFLQRSDVVSLQLRLTPETRHAITATDLQAMRPDALFVNTARAELLAPGALEQALATGRPGFAALDVFEQEPLAPEQLALVRHPRVLATPHIGFVERDNYEAYFNHAFDNILRFEAGERDHLLNAAQRVAPR